MPPQLVPVAIRRGGGTTLQLQLPADTTVAALRVLLSRDCGSEHLPRLVHMGALLANGDSRPLAEWHNPSDVIRVVAPASPPAAPRAVQPVRTVVRKVEPFCGPEAGGTRVSVAGSGFSPQREWCLRFGSVVVRASAVREGYGDGEGEESWSLVCSTPANPPGIVSVDVLSEAGEVCTHDGGGGSFTYLSARQWAAIVAQVAAPSHARGCMLAASDEDIAEATAASRRR